MFTFYSQKAGGLYVRTVGFWSGVVLALSGWHLL